MKHSGATEAQVDLSGHGDGIDLCISDSGTGFSPESATEDAGLGLISMRERLRLVEGTPCGRIGAVAWDADSRACSVPRRQRRSHKRQKSTQGWCLSITEVESHGHARVILETYMGGHCSAQRPGSLGKAPLNNTRQRCRLAPRLMPDLTRLTRTWSKTPREESQFWAGSTEWSKTVTRCSLAETSDRR